MNQAYTGAQRNEPSTIAKLDGDVKSEIIHATLCGSPLWLGVACTASPYQGTYLSFPTLINCHEHGVAVPQQRYGKLCLNKFRCKAKQPMAVFYMLDSVMLGFLHSRELTSRIAFSFKYIGSSYAVGTITYIHTFRCLEGTPK